jgi:hypothetical protein
MRLGLIENERGPLRELAQGEPDVRGKDLQIRGPLEVEIRPLTKLFASVGSPHCRAPSISTAGNWVASELRRGRALRRIMQSRMGRSILQGKDWRLLRSGCREGCGRTLSDGSQQAPRYENWIWTHMPGRAKRHMCHVSGQVRVHSSKAFSFELHLPSALVNGND